ncbi:MAG: hypothetical protein M0Z52_05970 [Actinomycetota bacterium]|nr:hypothetical protein [Actinomycetota bacterium]
MKKTLGLALLVLMFAFVPMVMAQGNDGGMTNAPSAQLPELTGSQSGNFEASSMSDAQNICDQVASANNKVQCVPYRNEAAPTNVQTYHCNCK